MATEISSLKGLPYNEDAERSILGAILIDNNAYNTAVQIVKRDDFYLESHRRIFDSILDLGEANQSVDLVTLAERLSRRGDLESIGGAAYLSALTDGLPRSTNVEYYARIVKEKSLLRKMINVSNGVIQQCMEGDGDAEVLLDRAENSFFQLAEDRVRVGFYHIQQVFNESLHSLSEFQERRRQVTGVKSGYDDLDRLISGLQPSELIILAARPSMGKTALALNIAEHVALHQNKTVGIFSLEMSREAVLLRILSSVADVDASRVRSGFFDKTEQNKLANGLDRLVEAPLFIDDTPNLSILEMRAKARRLQREHGLALLIVDYLQLMSGHGRFENRVQEVSSITRGLKALAKELNIPVLALSQLSRAPEQERTDHRPQLSHLRESGSIEQDADVVMFIFRESYYKRDQPDNRQAELIIAKQRNGPVGNVNLVFMWEKTRFESMEV
ncbi:MAG: replicative DNA helicase [Acidobacteriia bacterium]|nr:replicative DNA helicase [Terriglobia bacterium]